jgi:hypothetical protein
VSHAYNPVFGRLRQENEEFLRPCLKKKEDKFPLIWKC